MRKLFFILPKNLKYMKYDKVGLMVDCKAYFWGIRRYMESKCNHAAALLPDYALPCDLSV
jgi:hypothetical protein